jgi:hypothetical protein
MAREKYILLFPLTYNDGTTIPLNIFREFREEVFVIAGGSTVTGTVDGEYRMTQTGEKRAETLLQVWVVIDKKDAPALRQVVAVYAGRLGQESMYFERTLSEVEFVEPIAVGGANQ